MQGVAQIRILGQRGPDWASQTLRGYVGLKVYVYGNSQNVILEKPRNLKFQAQKTFSMQVFPDTYIHIILRVQ